MTELPAILAALGELRAAGRPAVLATIVRTEGSTYRRPGARMLIADDGAWLAGSISGGCLESDILASAGKLTAGGRPALVDYDTRRDADVLFGHGTGCRGLVSVLLERLDGDAPGVPELLAGCVLRHRRPAVLATRLDRGPALGQHLLLDSAGGVLANTFADRGLADAVLGDAAGALDAGRSDWKTYPAANGAGVRFEHLHPPPSLTLYGTGHDAAPVLRLAKTLGWHVAIGGPRAAGAEARLAGADRLIFGSGRTLLEKLRPEPGGAALLMTHNYFSDLLLLETLVHAPVRYLGILGPRARRERLLSDLAKHSPPPTAEQLARILYAPAGLDLGADGPEGIALSVVSEIQAVLAAGGCPGHLRERRGPIHAPTPEAPTNAPTDPDLTPAPVVACALTLQA